MYLTTQSKKGISSIEFGRRLGVTQTTAWTLKHKLAQVMIERNAAKRLEGEVQMDDAYIGGHSPETYGRGARGKTPFVAAVSLTGDGKPDWIVLRRVPGFSKIAIAKLAGAAFASGVHAVPMRSATFPP
jgi:ISXO2-like transposase domain